MSGHSDQGTQRGGSFTELDVLRSADGLKAIISQRKSTGVITCAIVKEFQRDGETVTTGFIPESLMDDYITMAQLAKKRIEELRRTGAVPAPQRAHNSHR